MAQLVCDVLRGCVEYWAHTSGVLGDHLEKTICSFGAPAVAAAISLNDGVLTDLIRRDRKPDC